MKTLTPRQNLKGRNVPVKLNSELAIFRYYQERAELETDSALADALDIDRRRLFNWLSGRQSPDLEWLQSVTVKYAGNWQSHLAVDMLTLREQEIPCLCLEYIGDNGPCPKHVTLVQLDNEDAKRLFKVVKP